MKTVYEHFSGKKFDDPPPENGKGSVKAIHYIQSFDPKDNISPELAHKIGRAFARKAFGDNCQLIIATHIDKAHVHNHIIINTYGIDGHKFNDNWTTRQKLREISDRVCLAFGIKSIETKRGASKNVEYNEWEHKRRGTSWKEKIRNEIDRLVGFVKSVDELLEELEHLGYTIKRGKYISVKAPEQQRAVRLKTLGEDYTPESLASRILWRDVGAGILNPCEYSEMRDRYNSAINEIGRATNTSDIYKLSAQLTIINRDNLQSIGELEGKIEQLKIEVKKARMEVNTMETKCNNLKSLAVQAEEFFALLDKPQHTDEEKLKLEMYRETLIRNNVQSQADFEFLKGVIAETEQKAAPVRAHYKKCTDLFREYSEIADTYREISQGDYISKLIEQQRKQGAPKTRPRR